MYYVAIGLYAVICSASCCWSCSSSRASGDIAAAFGGSSSQTALPARRHGADARDDDSGTLFMLGALGTPS